jgi:hypothetical protein
MGRNMVWRASENAKNQEEADGADLNRDWYFARCREVQAAPNGYLDLWGREHGKSSLITFGLTIQDILNDPEITVGIFSYLPADCQSVSQTD